MNWGIPQRAGLMARCAATELRFYKARRAGNPRRVAAFPRNSDCGRSSLLIADGPLGSRGCQTSSSSAPSAPTSATSGPTSSTSKPSTAPATSPQAAWSWFPTTAAAFDRARARAGASAPGDGGLRAPSRGVARPAPEEDRSSAARVQNVGSTRPSAAVPPVHSRVRRHER